MRQLIVFVLAGVALARPSYAQGHIFVTGDVFADVKRFSGDTSSLPLDGSAFGAGARVGIALAPQWTAELGFDLGRSTTNLRDLTPVSLSSVVQRQSRTQSRLIATSVVVGFHPHTTGRVQFGYFGGLAIVHAIRKTDTLVGGTPVPIGARQTVDNVSAATMGLEARVRVSSHLAIVTEVRALTFSLSGIEPSGFAIRPGVGARWTF